jgi:Xaa-Pro aminopeptidase
MQQRGLAGLVVLALDRYSPAFYYATGQKIHHGFYVRTSDGRAHLVHDPMERDQAALAGCEWSTYAQHGFLAMVKSADSQAEALAKLVAKIAGELRLEGPVAFAGDAPLGYSWSMLSHLKAIAPSIQVDGRQPDVIYEAMETKDESELEKIRHCSRGAVDAMQRVAKYLGSLQPRHGSLTDGVNDVVLVPMTVPSTVSVASWFTAPSSISVAWGRPRSGTSIVVS